MDKKKSALSRNIWISAILFAALILTLINYIFADREIEQSSKLQANAWALADDLRQSCDDLNHMALNFVITGDAIYQKYYRYILDIRDGKQPQPQDYHNLYWPLVIASNQPPIFSSKPAIALLDAARKLTLTDLELKTLSQAKNHGELLVLNELRAMELVSRPSQDLIESRTTALNMLFNESYRRASAANAQSISDFNMFISERMQLKIDKAKNRIHASQFLLVTLLILLLFMLWRTNQTLHAILGGTLDTVYHYIINLGNGNFKSMTMVKRALKNSILGWLSQTQETLRESQENHKQTETSLRESEMRYRRIVLTAEEGIWSIDADGNTLFANPKMAALLGYNETNLLGKPISDFMDDDSKSILAITVEQCHLGIANKHDMKFLHQDGSELWCQFSISPIFGTENNYLGALAMVTDITARRQNELALQEAYLYTQAILDNMADGVIVFNGNGDIESFNTAAHSIFGYSFDEIIDCNLSLLIVENQNIFAKLSTISNDESFETASQLNVKGKHKNGIEFPVSFSVSTLSRAGRMIYVGVIRDVTIERKNIEEVHRLAFYDPLTELPNRRLFSDRLSQAILSATRTRQHGALMFLDLDHFKQLNDTLGHDIGDELLQQVASRLQSCVRDCDTVGRLGGDEFVVLLEALNRHPIDAASQTEVIANKILATLGQPYNLCEHSYVSTPSIGIVVFRDNIESDEELFKKADVAMYQAKAMGRNTARFFDPTMQAALSVRIEQESNMRRALLKNEFILHYQIQVNREGMPTGVEALVRWNHGVHGLISPSAFIPMAEETGMILPIGKWVLEAACKQLVEWAAQPMMTQWTMAVNISAAQFSRADFIEVLQEVLDKTGASPTRLKLELTESLLVNDIDDVIVKMNTIKKLGITFSLDDFGTGHSSLLHLKRLPFDQLKIDRCFIHNVMNTPSDNAIARTVINLGHSLGLKVIAEGVETSEQRNALAEMGCDEYQGYYFGYPAPMNELTQGLESAPK